MVRRIQRFYKDFTSFSTKTEMKYCLFHFVKWLYYRIRYGIDMEGYFENGIWRRDVNKTPYFEQFHKYIHSWKYSYTHFKPSARSEFYYKIDYFFSKLECPGLDAMDYFRYHFYEYRYDKKKTFITEGGIKKMDKLFNGGAENIKYLEMLRDKPSFNNYFSEYIYRDWLETYHNTIDAYKAFFAKHQSAIIKPIDGGGGHGVHKVTINCVNDLLDLYDNTKDHRFIVEELIDQHPIINSINPSSVNSIRVCSVEYQGKFYITSALIRIGKGNNITDNYSSGGLAASIDVETGIVVSPGVSQDNDYFYLHPVSKMPIIGLKIPEWQNILETVKTAHSKIPQLRYIGWDVVVTNNNKITFIEANTCSGVELQQHPLNRGVKELYKKYY